MVLISLKDTIFRLFKNRSVQNFAFFSIIQASNILISLISMPLLIKSIGVEQFGLVSLSLSVIILVNIFVSFGFNLSSPRQVALSQKSYKKLSVIFSNVLFSKILLAVVAVAALSFAVFALDLFKEYQMILLFSCLLVFSEATLPLWFFQGMEKMKLLSIANILSKLLYLLGIVLLIREPGQAMWVNFLLGGTSLVVNVGLLCIIYLRMNISFFLPKIKTVFQSIRANVLFFLSIVASHISLSGGIIILSFFSGAALLGMFGLAEKVSSVSRMLPSLVIQAVYPNASRLYNFEKERYYSYTLKVTGWAMALGTATSVLVFFFAPVIIRVLSGQELPEAVGFLKILAFAPALACLNNLNMTIFLVKNQKNLIFIASWVSCIYMVVSATVMTHFYGGIGLSTALVSTEIVMFSVSVALNLKVNNSDIRLFWNVVSGRTSKI